MNKILLFTEKFKKKKYLFSILLLIVSCFLLSFNAKFILNADITGSANMYVSYITPFYASYKRDKPAVMMVDSNAEQYQIVLNAKMIKKIRIIFSDKSNNFAIKINSAGIKLPYMPVLFFDNNSIVKIEGGGMS